MMILSCRCAPHKGHFQGLWEASASCIPDDVLWVDTTLRFNLQEPHAGHAATNQTHTRDHTQCTVVRGSACAGWFV